MFANSGTFRDVSGNGHDAAIIGDPIIGHDGPFGLSDADIEVNRYNYVQVPNLNPLIGDSSRTIEFWFRIGRRPTEECLFSSGFQSQSAAFSICVTDGNQFGSPTPGRTGIYLQTYGADVYLPIALFNGNWHYVAVTLDRSEVTVDLDGHLPDGFIWNGSSYSSRLAQPFVLPAQPNTAASAGEIGGPGWKIGAQADIDDVAVYGSALSVSNLNADYRTGRSLSK